MSMTNDRWRKIFDIFRIMFPAMADTLKNYSPMDSKSIRLTTDNRSVLIFTFIDKNRWNLTTEKQYYEMIKVSKSPPIKHRDRNRAYNESSL